MSKLQPIFIESGGYRRKIGDLDKLHKRFYKQVDSRKHKFRVLDAYGIDSLTLTKKLLPDYTIYLEEVDTGNWYSVAAKEFKEKGQYYHFKDKVDNDLQIFLPIREWKKFTEEEKWKQQQGF